MNADYEDKVFRCMRILLNKVCNPDEKWIRHFFLQLRDDELITKGWFIFCCLLLLTYLALLQRNRECMRRGVNGASYIYSNGYEHRDGSHVSWSSEVS